MREDCGPGSGRCCRRGGGGGGGGGDGHGGGMRWLLEPAILSALGAHPAHGYDLRLSLDELTDGFLGVDPGGLYRQLRRMEDDGLVASAWESGEHGPQRRTYQLTEEGLDVLRCWIDRLGARRSAIDGILAAARSATHGAGGATPTSPAPPTRPTDKEQA